MKPINVERLINMINRYMKPIFKTIGFCIYLLYVVYNLTLKPPVAEPKIYKQRTPTLQEVEYVDRMINSVLKERYENNGK